MRDSIHERLQPQSQLDKSGSWSNLSATWQQRLAGYGVNSPGDWRGMSRSQRGRMFGITCSLVARFAAAASRRS